MCKELTLWFKEEGSFQKLEKNARKRECVCGGLWNRLRDKDPDREGKLSQGSGYRPTVLLDMDFSAHGKLVKLVAQSAGPPGGHCNLKPGRLKPDELC